MDVVAAYGIASEQGGRVGTVWAAQEGLRGSINGKRISMPAISADIPASLKAELDKEASRSGRSASAIVTAALASYLEKPIHTVFQASTSGALVAGVYDRAAADGRAAGRGRAGAERVLENPGDHRPTSVPSRSTRLNFLSADRRHGGHLLDVEADDLALQVEALTQFQLVLPESAAFLKADLGKNTADELAYAERAH